MSIRINDLALLWPWC